MTPVVGQVTQNGQLLIGSSVAPFIRAGFLTSLDGTVTITNGPGTIDLHAAGGGGGSITLTGNTGGGLTGTSFSLLGAGSISIGGSGSSLTTQLNTTNHAILIGSSTTTLTALGPNATAGKVVMSAGAAADPIFSTPTYPSASGSSGVIITSDGTNNIYSTSTYPNGNATGDLIYGSGSNAYSNLAISTNVGDFLQYNGTNVSWLGPHNCTYMIEDCHTYTGAYGSLVTVLGTGSTNTISSTSGNPGILNMTIGTTTTGSVSYMLGGSSSKPVYIGAGAIYTDFYVQLGTLSNGTDGYTAYIGFNISIGISAVNSVYFSYTDSTNSGNWVLNSVAASTATTSNTSTAADTNWHRYTIIANAGGTSLNFYVDGVSVGSAITTHIPTVGMAPFIQILKNKGTTGPTIYVDYIKHIQLLTTTR